MRLLVVPALLAVAFAVGGPPARAAAPTRPSAADHFTPAEIARSDAYNRPRRAISLTSLAISIAVIALLALGRTGRAAAEVAARAAGGRAWLAAAILAAVVAIGPSLVTFPLAVVAHRRDRTFGLSTQGFAAFGLDHLKAAAFQVVLVAAVGAVLIALGRALPRGWPIPAAAGAALLTVLLVMVIPVLVDPAFNRFTPASDDVRARVEALARAANVRVGDVLVVDASRRTTRHNAYVTGIGPTKRVVIYDTLLQGAPTAEVDLVVAHELAHVRHGDVVRATWLGVLGTIAGVGVLWWLLRAVGVAAGEPRAVALVALLVAVGSLVTAPVVSAVSRRAEARADATALDLVSARSGDVAGTVRTAVDLEIRLARTNLADLDPPGWVVWAFASHPPVLERIGAALAYGAAHR